MYLAVFILSFSSSYWMKLKTIYETSTSLFIETLFMLFLSQFLSSIIIEIGVAGVTFLIE